MKTVEAADKLEIELIHRRLLLSKSPMTADVWKIGVNLSLRVSDLLGLKYSDLDLPNRLLVLKEAKTGKNKIIRLNQTVISIVERRRLDNPGDTWIFQGHSNRGQNKPISRSYVSRVFKAAGQSIGKPINTHSMRKSRGMAMYKDGVPIEMIAKVLNHSNTSVTMAYLGITREEILRTYDDYEL